jgi:hypothetical protein
MQHLNARNAITDAPSDESIRSHLISHRHDKGSSGNPSPSPIPVSRSVSYLGADLGERRASTVVAKNLAALSQYVRTHYSPAERRRDPRFETDSPVVVVKLNPFAAEHLTGRLRDVSRNGLGLWVPESVIPGSILQIRLGTIFLMGEVRYCQKNEEVGWCLVGVLLQDVFAKY